DRHLRRRRRRAARPARKVRRRVRALRHGRADLATTRGRHLVDASVRIVVAYSRRRPRLVPRTGDRVPRLAADPGRSERVARVRTVQAGPRWQPRAVVPPGARDLRWPERRDQLLPGHRAAVPALRPAAEPRTTLTR